MNEMDIFEKLEADGLLDTQHTVPTQDDHEQTFEEIRDAYYSSVETHIKSLQDSNSVNLNNADHRFSGSINLNSIRTRSVVVIGAGGIGSWVIRAIAGMGFQNITVYDDDIIEHHNVGPQGHALTDIGTLKVDAMYHEILRLRGTVIIRKSTRVTSYNELIQDLGEAPSILISAVDNMEIRNVLSKELLLDEQMEINYPDLYIDLRMSMGEWNAFTFPVKTMRKFTVRGNADNDSVMNKVARQCATYSVTRELLLPILKSKKFTKLYKALHFNDMITTPYESTQSYFIERDTTRNINFYRDVAFALHRYYTDNMQSVLSYFEKNECFEASEGIQEACTERAIIYTGMNIGSYTAAMLHWMVNNKFCSEYAQMHCFLSSEDTSLSFHALASFNSRMWEFDLPNSYERKLRTKVMQLREANTEAADKVAYYDKALYLIPKRKEASVSMKKTLDSTLEWYPKTVSTATTGVLHYKLSMQDLHTMVFNDTALIPDLNLHNSHLGILLHKYTRHILDTQQSIVSLRHVEPGTTVSVTDIKFIVPLSIHETYNVHTIVQKSTEDSLDYNVNSYPLVGALSLSKDSLELFNASYDNYQYSNEMAAAYNDAPFVKLEGIYDSLGCEEEAESVYYHSEIFEAYGLYNIPVSTINDCIKCAKDTQFGYIPIPGKHLPNGIVYGELLFDSVHVLVSVEYVPTDPHGKEVVEDSVVGGSVVGGINGVYSGSVAGGINGVYDGSVSGDSVVEDSVVEDSAEEYNEDDEFEDVVEDNNQIITKELPVFIVFNNKEDTETVHSLTTSDINSIDIASSYDQLIYCNCTIPIPNINSGIIYSEQDLVWIKDMIRWICSATTKVLEDGITPPEIMYNPNKKLIQFYGLANIGEDYYTILPYLGDNSRCASVLDSLLIKVQGVPEDYPLEDLVSIRTDVPNTTYSVFRPSVR